MIDRFVVRKGLNRGYNFAEEYMSIFKNDLPVFITTDSILHAFRIPVLHIINTFFDLNEDKSYDSVMTHLESTYLSVILRHLLEG